MQIVSIGIDVSKGKLDAGFILKDQTTKNLRKSNDQEGIPKLVKMLKSRQEDVEDIPVVIEATGGYHYGITFAFLEKGFRQVRVINPLITKKHLKGTVRKVKTDKKDAVLLARIGLLEELKNYTETKEEILLKRKARLYHFLKKELQRVNNRLSSVRSLNLDDDFEINILEESKQDLELKLEKVRKELLKGIKLKFPKIQGVSEFSLKAMAAELGNVARFENHKQVIAFAGLDPTVKESGTSVKGRSALSKRGSKTLRYYLYQSAWGVMMHNDKYREYYHHKKNVEKKHYYTCLSAVARKLLCEIYFNLKEHSYYIK